MSLASPDDLTPREREVLGLIRLGLTNKEIAQRLGIHAGWGEVPRLADPLQARRRDARGGGERRRRWWGQWPLVAKIAGAATVVVAVAGLGLLAWGVLRTEGEDAETSLPTGSAPTTAEGTAAERSGMAHYTNDVFKVQFDYPNTWVLDRDYSGSVSGISAESYKDPRGREFGFFVVDACCKDGLTLDDAAALFAGRVARPYGEHPRIESLTLDDGEARLILPNERASDIDDAQLLIHYDPSPIYIGTLVPAIFILQAHKDFIRDIASTLRLTSSFATP